MLRGSGKIESMHRFARQIAPPTMGMALADAMFALYFSELNMKGIVDYKRQWPICCKYVSDTNLVDLLQIWIVSKQLGVTCPFPKLPWTTRDATFGWNAATGFMAASNTSRQLTTLKPSNISEEAVTMVSLEIQDIAGV